MATGAVIGQEPYWEPAQDMLGGVDLNSWRTPGIVASVSHESEADNWKKDFSMSGITGGFGTVDKQPEKDKKIPENIFTNFFTRTAFILIGLIFITISLIMISRPAQEGIVEGIKEGLEA